MGKEVPPHLKRSMVSGADEVDLVRSALDDTMCNAYNSLREVYLGRDEVPDMRTAAFVVAIEKIARAYMESGI